MGTNTNAPSGAYLDYAVAVADGRLNPHVKNGECLITHGGEGGPVVRFDAAWFKLQILPREGSVGLVVQQAEDGNGFVAGYAAGGALANAQRGASDIEALMRAFVWKRLEAWPSAGLDDSPA